MSNDGGTRERVRELLRSGRLPVRRPDDIWGGYGCGRNECLVCGNVVAPQDVAMEAVFSEPAGSTTFFFHAGCFWVLESEWRRVENAADSTDPEAPAPADQLG